MKTHAYIKRNCVTFIYLFKYCLCGYLRVLCEGCNRQLKYDGKKTLEEKYYGQARCTKKPINGSNNWGCEKS